MKAKGKMDQEGNLKATQKTSNSALVLKNLTKAQVKKASRKKQINPIGQSQDQSQGQNQDQNQDKMECRYKSQMKKSGTKTKNPSKKETKENLLENPITSLANTHLTKRVSENPEVVSTTTMTCQNYPCLKVSPGRNKIH